MGAYKDLKVEKKIKILSTDSKADLDGEGSMVHSNRKEARVI
jgi:hypothetical protein